MQASLLLWHDFFLAEAGASSALAGLLFVAVSINLPHILKFSHLPTRAIEALLTLLSLLVVATFGLVPNQSSITLGVEFLGTGVLIWAAQTVALCRTRRSGYETVIRVVMNQCPSYPIMVSGLALILGSETGLYWLVPAAILALFSGVYSAWILLVEIQR